MSEMNKQAVRRLYDEMVSEGRFEVLDEVVKEDVIENEAAAEEMPGGRAGVRAFFEAMRAAFPDLKAEVGRLLAEDDRVVAHVTLSGTQEGEFMGVPASGRRFEAELFDMFRIEDGMIAEHWGVMDQMTMMQQLGAIPGPAEAG